MGRHQFDRYDSPHWFVTAIAPYVELSGTFGEPCLGGGIIKFCLENIGLKAAFTNDIDTAIASDFHFDVSNRENWDKFPECDWIITNPPYGRTATPILINSFEHCKKGCIFFLRTTWEEPCEDRAQFLYENPYTRKITFPRFKFRRGASGRWATDACTISAFIWVKDSGSKASISLPPTRIRLFHDNPENAPDIDAIAQLCHDLSVFPTGK